MLERHQRWDRDDSLGQVVKPVVLLGKGRVVLVQALYELRWAFSEDVVASATVPVHQDVTVLGRQRYQRISGAQGLMADGLR